MVAVVPSLRHMLDRNRPARIRLVDSTDALRDRPSIHAPLRGTTSRTRTLATLAPPRVRLAISRGVPASRQVEPCRCAQSPADTRPVSPDLTTRCPLRMVHPLGKVPWECTFAQVGAAFRNYRAASPPSTAPMGARSSLSLATSSPSIPTPPRMGGVGRPVGRARRPTCGGRCHRVECNEGSRAAPCTGPCRAEPSRPPSRAHGRSYDPQHVQVAATDGYRRHVARGPLHAGPLHLGPPATSCCPGHGLRLLAASSVQEAMDC